MLWRLLLEVRRRDPPVTHLVAVFDKSDRSFRNDLDPGYKSGRPPTPKDLACQFTYVRQAARAFGLAVREAQGYEADDIIAAFTARASASGARVTIVSSDKDLMQLVSSNVVMHDPMKNVDTDMAGVEEKYGVAPDKLTDVFALAGDSSDSIRGVKGIGLVTAAELIGRFGDLESVLAGADTISQPARRRNLLEQADQARLAYRLVKLDDRAPAEDIASCELPERIDYAELIEFLERMEFRTLTRRVREAAGRSVPPQPELQVERFVDGVSYQTVTDVEVLQDWVGRARQIGMVAIGVHTDGDRAVDASLVGVSLAVGRGQACYVPLFRSCGDLEDERLEHQIDLSQAALILGSLISDRSVLKIGHALSFGMTVLSQAGIGRVEPMDDIQSLSFVTGAGLGGHGLVELSRRYLDHDLESPRAVLGSDKGRIGFSSVRLDRATAYAAEIADVILRLWFVLRRLLVSRRVFSVYETIERPLIGVIADMECAGVLVDPDRLRALSAEFAVQARSLEEEAHRLAGRAFNPGSPRQVGEILFGCMGLEGGRRTKTGAWSTAAGTLESLAARGHGIADIILRWRHVSKLKHTYSDALIEAISPRTGRVHTSFSLAGAQTGRLSSTDPNLQNIPVRTQAGRRIRASFVAQAGCRLVSADYSQIELRLLAHIADLGVLREVFAQGGDVHAMTAAELSGVGISQVDASMRRRAKAINFGIIYGISAFGLANQLGVSRVEAAGYIKAYFARFPGILEYMEAMKHQARSRGYVETIFGRVCHVPMIGSGKPPERAFAERQAINAPVQGSAADIIKRAMVRIPGALQDAGLSARMLLQVHDELLFEAPEQECDAVQALVSRVMEQAAYPVVELSVPLTVVVSSGSNWSQAHQ